jgi:hypothetical protein
MIKTQTQRDVLAAQAAIAIHYQRRTAVDARAFSARQYVAHWRACVAATANGATVAPIPDDQAVT